MCTRWKINVFTVIKIRMLIIYTLQETWNLKTTFWLDMLEVLRDKWKHGDVPFNTWGFIHEGYNWERTGQWSVASWDWMK